MSKYRITAEQIFRENLFEIAKSAQENLHRSHQNLNIVGISVKASEEGEKLPEHRYSYKIVLKIGSSENDTCFRFANEHIDILKEAMGIYDGNGMLRVPLWIDIPGEPEKITFGRKDHYACLAVPFEISHEPSLSTLMPRPDKGNERSFFTK